MRDIRNSALRKNRSSIRNMVFSGLRQVGIGATAAIVTYMVGRLIGVNVGG